MDATRENNIRSYTEKKKKKKKKKLNILHILPFQVHYQILHMQIYGNIVLILAYFHFRNKEDILETFLFKFFLHNTSVMSISKINLHEEILMNMAHYPKIIPTTLLYLELCLRNRKGWMRNNSQTK